MTSGASCCDSVGMLGCIHSFFALFSALSLRLFRFVEVSIFSSCSVFFFFAFFFAFLEVVMEVELLIRLVLIRLVLLLLLFCWCGSFCYYFCCCCFCCFYCCCYCFCCCSSGSFYCSFFFPGDLGPPFFWFWVVPRFRGRISGCADGLFRVAATVVVDVAAAVVVDVAAGLVVAIL